MRNAEASFRATYRFGRKITFRPPGFHNHTNYGFAISIVSCSVNIIQSQIQRFLKDMGIEKIKTVGEKFDPNIHEAIETEEAGNKEDGLVVAELKPGYRFNGHLLRPASVKIAKKKLT